MAKRKQSNRKRNRVKAAKRRRSSPLRISDTGPDTDARVRHITEATWDLPMLAGSQDVNRASQYMERFMAFENWILDGRRDDQLDPDALPPEYLVIMSRWPEAFEMFRHAVWSLAESVLGMNSWTSTIRSLLLRARFQDPDGFDKLENALERGILHFTTQRNNVLHQASGGENYNPREWARAMLKMYADMYEVDLPLWLLGVLGRAYRTGKVKPEAFGGPNTSVPQGALIDAVADAVRGTPVAPLLERCYLPRLRNAVNHNSYEVIVESGDITDRFTAIKDTTSGEQWLAGQVVDAWQNTVHLINSSFSACASVENVIMARSPDQLVDCGVVGINYAVVNEVPVAVVAQLWCFRDLDPAGKWLDRSQFVFENDGPGRERAGFTCRAFVSGVSLSDSIFGKALRDRGWIRVLRLPVAPHMEMGFPVFEHTVAGEYEIVGVQDEHDIPVRLASPWPRADLLPWPGT